MRKDLVMFRTLKVALVSLSMALYSAPAFAHPGHVGEHSFLQGLLHPLSGLDHVLAMVCVGFLAFRLGGRALWAIPAAFLVAMSVGGLLGAAGVEIPAVEQGIATSVLVLGVLIACTASLTPLFVVPLIALFAIFHGVAHGAEGAAAGGASILHYFAGFLLATASLLGAGSLLAKGLASVPQGDALRRVAGASVGLAGLLILIG